MSNKMVSNERPYEFAAPVLHTERQMNRLLSEGDEVANSVDFGVSGKDDARQAPGNRSKAPSPSSKKRLFAGIGDTVLKNQSVGAPAKNKRGGVQRAMPSEFTNSLTKSANFGSQDRTNFNQIAQQINLRNSQNQFFRLNLPHSRAYLDNLDVAKFSEVTRPETFTR